MWNDRNAYRVEDGDSAVTFEACKEGRTGPGPGPLKAMTQFNGGFVVAGARCVLLDVLVPGEQTTRIALPFGVGSCPDSA